MPTKPQGNTRNTGKIALLVGVIVVALIVLGFSFFRSNTDLNGGASGEVKQMKTSARSRKRSQSLPGMGQ